MAEPRTRASTAAPPPPPAGTCEDDESDSDLDGLTLAGQLQPLRLQPPDAQPLTQQPAAAVVAAATAYQYDLKGSSSYLMDADDVNRCDRTKDGGHGARSRAAHVHPPSPVVKPYDMQGQGGAPSDTLHQPLSRCSPTPASQSNGHATGPAATIAAATHSFCPSGQQPHRDGRTAYSRTGVAARDRRGGQRRPRYVFFRPMSMHLDARSSKTMQEDYPRDR
jgi:hypothetical protein